MGHRLQIHVGCRNRHRRCQIRLITSRTARCEQVEHTISAYVLPVPVWRAFRYAYLRPGRDSHNLVVHRNFEECSLWLGAVNLSNLSDGFATARVRTPATEEILSLDFTPKWPREGRTNTLRWLDSPSGG